MIAIVIIAIVVALVAIDAIARLDERRLPGPKPPRRDPALVTTQKIVVVDLNRRD